MTIHVAFQPNAYNDPVPASAGGTFASFVGVLRDLVAAETPCADLTNKRSVDAAKASMPAVIPARLSPERMAARLARGEKTARGSEVVEGSSLVGLDIDRAPPEAVDAAITRLQAGNVAAIVHGSPTDGVDPAVRKVRIYIAADRELAPAEIWPARVAWARALGLDAWLDPQTSDPSRLFFAGRLQGTPERAFVVTGAEPVPIDTLLRAFPVPVAPPQAAPIAPAPTTWAAGAEHEQRMTPALVALLAPEYERGQRHNKARALGAVLAQNGWTDAAIEAVVGALPSDKPEARVVVALEAAARARNGDPVPQRRALSAAFGDHTADLVFAIAKQPAVAELERSNAALAAPEPQPAYSVLKIDDINTPIPAVNWFCERLRIAPGAPTIVAGYGGLGKSMFVQLLVVCAVVGRACLTYAVRRAKVLHLDYEQGPHETASRYKRLAADIGLRGRDLYDGLDVLSPPPFNLLSPNAEAVFTALCKGYDVLVIDSLRAATPGLDENSSEIREPLDMLFRVSVATGCTIIVIHHARKATKDNGNAGNQNMRGNSAINDAAQAVLMLEPIENGFTITPGKVRIGKAFEPLDIVIEDTDIEGVPFKGLNLSVVNADARKAQHAAIQRTLAHAVDTLVLAWLEKNPGFKGSKRTIWDTMKATGANGDYTRNEIMPAVVRLEAANKIKQDGGRWFPIIGTPGVFLGPDGTPTHEAP